jgi:hypothetical protein
MDPLLVSYLSVRYESAEEQKYLQGLVSQYLSAIETESYHMALFAYHLLFMSFIYQTIHKIKIWLPDQFRLALITFPAKERDEYLSSTSPWAYSKIRERTIFGLLHLLEDCGDLIADCKENIVDYRNDHLGHANPIIVDEEEFYKKVAEYDTLSEKIQKLTHAQLNRIFSEFVMILDPADELTQNDIELNLVVPNRCSDKDLECFSADCHVGRQPVHQKVIEVLRDSFGVEVTLVV